MYRNFRSKRGGEVDLVCRDKDVLVFVEVKTRSTDTFGAPHDAVTPSQQTRIRRGAIEWLRLLNNPKIVYRFDIVEVLMDSSPRINLIRGAFEMHDEV
ncbi:MAG: YraN family protein [Verrucomicrobia bacterium]|nr:YraN family protein [Verrucomicrobiota bacterium]